MDNLKLKRLHENYDILQKDYEELEEKYNKLLSFVKFQYEQLNDDTAKLILDEIGELE